MVRATYLIASARKSGTVALRMAELLSPLSLTRFIYRTRARLIFEILVRQARRIIAGLNLRFKASPCDLNVRNDAA